jgi:hypothetical protein
MLAEVRNDQKLPLEGYDPETKQQSSQYKDRFSPHQMRVMQVRSNIKRMLVTFFDYEGTVHQEFVPPGETVNQYYHQEALQCLRQQVYQKCLERRPNQAWVIHHNNAPMHTAVQQFLAVKTLLWSPIFLTILIWPLVIPSCFQA